MAVAPRQRVDLFCPFCNVLSAQNSAQGPMLRFWKYFFAIREANILAMETQNKEVFVQIF
jgi:hypothetical protein